jgi:hypothetical protein
MSWLWRRGQLGLALFVAALVLLFLGVLLHCVAIYELAIAINSVDVGEAKGRR